MEINNITVIYHKVFYIIENKDSKGGPHRGLFKI